MVKVVRRDTNKVLTEYDRGEPFFSTQDGKWYREAKYVYATEEESERSPYVQYVDEVHVIKRYEVTSDARGNTIETLVE